MKTKQIAINAALAAMCVILAALSLGGGNFKFTLESFPVLLAGAMFGPLSGAIVGFVGSFIYQCFFSGYGLCATTLLWVIPHVFEGVFIGQVAKKSRIDSAGKDFLIYVILAEILTTILNTAAMYVDSLIGGYFSTVYVFGSLIYRLAIALIKGAVFGFILPLIIKRVKKALN